MTVPGHRDGEPLVDGVLVDIDDTLVDTRGAFVAALSVIAEQYLPHVAPERRGEVVATWRADVGGHYGAYTRGELGYLDQRMARANALHAEFGGAVLDEAGYAQWNAVFEEEFARAWVAHPDAVPVVDELLGSGIAVGALTNAAIAYQTTKLERAGLAHVPVLVGVDTFGFGKPDPRVFLEACRLLGTDPARTAYVGDELDVDARAAVAVGLIGVWVDRPADRRHVIPDSDIADAEAAGVQVVASLSEVPAVLGLGWSAVSEGGGV